MNQGCIASEQLSRASYLLWFGLAKTSHSFCLSTETGSCYIIPTGLELTTELKLSSDSQVLGL